jgi:hypothetical protein
MFQMTQLAELKVLYPEFNGLRFEDCLTGISADTLQRVSTYMIGKNLYAEADQNIQELISNWFSQGNSTFAQQFYDRVSDYEQRSEKKLEFVHIISCLKILQYGLELRGKGLLDTKSKEQSEIDILFALLICNQNEDYNQTKDKEKIKSLFPDNYPEALLFNYSFAVNDIVNFYFADYTYCQIVKALLLFGFLDSTNEGKEISKRFCSYYGIDNWREYFERVIPLISAWSNRDKPSSVDIVLDKNNSYHRNYSFLEKLAMSDYVKYEDVDYIKLREKPLLQLNDTTFRVIHPLFISDKIYKGLYFLLNQLNSKEPSVIKSFRSWYTTNFTEGVCLQEIIKYSIETFDVRFFDDELKVKKVVGPPDCYLRQKNNIFLIENKDILINAAIKDSYDFEALINEFKRKLLNENGRPVGIGQIVNNIRKLISKENSFDDQFDSGKDSIYPILIVHDIMYDVIGLNNILNTFFDQELAKLKAEGLNISNIKPLVLVNIDTLIQISDLLKDKKTSFDKVLDRYYDNSKLPAKQSPTAADFTDTLLPFSTFAINYCDKTFGHQWRSDRLLIHLFEQVGKKQKESSSNTMY